MLWEYFPMIKNVFIDLAAGSQEYPGVCLSRIKGMVSKWNMPALSDNLVEEIFEIANDQESAAVEDENSTKKKEEVKYSHKNNSEE